MKIKEPKPENEIEYIDSIECTYEIRGWITQISEEDKLTILGQEKPVKPENAIEERDSLLIPGLEKEQNQVEYIDELFLEELTKPE